MSIVFKGIDEPKACYNAKGNSIDPGIIPCKFYDICNKKVKEEGCRPSDCPIKKVPKELENLL